MTLIAFDQNEH